MIERAHLEILREIERRKTLTKAAASLHLSQSALSHAIRKLELQTGTTIWQKKGRNLHFTDAGRFLLDLANRVLPQFEYAEETFLRFAAGKKGLLRIGMECHPCYQWLLQVVHPYLQMWPEVDMDIKKKFQFDGINALIDNEIDLLITPDYFDDDSLQFTPVFSYEMMLVIPRNHPIADRNFVTPEELQGETLLTYPVEHDRLDIFRYFLQPANCNPAVHRVMEDGDIMIQMVAAGRGITTLPNWLVHSYLETLPLKVLRLGRSGLQKKLYTVIRKEDLTVDYIAAFIRNAEAIS